MTTKSKWIETELEHAGEVCLVPIRARLEARKNRLRTVIQRLEADQWVLAHKTDWVESKNAHRVREAELNKAAEVIADSLVDQVEAIFRDHP